MIDRIRRFFRKRARRFFSSQIVILQASRYVDGYTMLSMEEDDVKEMMRFVRRELIRKIAEEIAEQGRIIFEEEESFNHAGRVITAKLHII